MTMAALKYRGKADKLCAPLLCPQQTQQGGPKGWVGAFQLADGDAVPLA